MVQCKKCNDPVTIPFKCKACGETFCHKHRLAELHDCEGYLHKTWDGFVIEGDEAAIPGPATASPDSERVERVVAPSFDDDEDESPVPQRPAIQGNVFRGLLIFFLFLAVDAFGLMFPGGLLNLVAIVIHVAFLPPLIYAALKIKKGEINAELLETFGKLNLYYIATYMIAKVFTFIITGNIFLAFVFVFLGMQVLVTWLRFRAVMNFLRRNE